jgi:DNA-binding NarL/FixJ family response regulator
LSENYFVSLILFPFRVISRLFAGKNISKSMSEITIIIADDHPIVRQGLRQILEAESGLKIIAETEDGKSALKAITEFQPQIAILDIDMPEMDGFEVARSLKQNDFATQVIFLTIHQDEIMFNEAIDLGAKGYVLKQSALENIIHCIRTVAKNQHFVSPALTTFLINRNRRSLDLGTGKPTIKNLTRSEKRILQMIADDKTTNEIAEELFISPTTVEKHRANICRKLDLKGGYALLKFALIHKSELR